MTNEELGQIANSLRYCLKSEQAAVDRFEGETNDQNWAFRAAHLRGETKSLLRRLEVVLNERHRSHR